MESLENSWEAVCYDTKTIDSGSIPNQTKHSDQTKQFENPRKRFGKPR